MAECDYSSHDEEDEKEDDEDFNLEKIKKETIELEEYENDVDGEDDDDEDYDEKLIEQQKIKAEKSIINDFSDLERVALEPEEPFKQYAYNTTAKLSALKKIKFKAKEKHVSLDIIKEKLKSVNHKKSKILTNLKTKPHETLEELLACEDLSSPCKQYQQRLRSFIDDDMVVKRSLDCSPYTINIEDLKVKQVSCDHNACVKNMDNIHSYLDYKKTVNRNNPALAFFYNKDMIDDNFNVAIKCIPLSLDNISNDLIKKKN